MHYLSWCVIGFLVHMTHNETADMDINLNPDDPMYATPIFGFWEDVWFYLFSFYLFVFTCFLFTCFFLLVFFLLVFFLLRVLRLAYWM